jgi:hypothetical protein
MKKERNKAGNEEMWNEVEEREREKRKRWKPRGRENTAEIKNQTDKIITKQIRIEDINNKENEWRKINNMCTLRINGTNVFWRK